MSLLLAASGGAPSWSPYWAPRRLTHQGVMLMYPRNAASPQRLAVGPVVQISDGVVQTTGVSIKVMPQGGAASAGGGTTAYEEGIVHYVPTQAETNYASFTVIAYKTGCIPASMTVVTTASSTAGHAGLDWANIIAPTTTVNLSGTTVKTATDVEADTVDIQARLPAALVGGRMDANVGAMASNVITAAATAADYVTEVQSGLATQASVDVIDDFLNTEIAALITEVAKVPKSDGTATWNATALASIQQEATDALNAYDPPTNTEFNARTLASADYATATALATVNTVVDSIKQVTDAAIRASAITGTLSTTQMTTDLTEVTDDHYIGRLITWTSGVLIGQQTNVTDYAGATKMLTYTTTTDAPSNGDTFILT